MTTRPAMIFHVPYPLQAEPKAASGIRPKRMREAFEAIGYDVWEVSGYSHERKQRIQAIQRRISHGERPLFLYSESSTMPTALTDPNHLPLHPRMDLSFLSFCRRNGIPTGLFYRDMHWMFAEYRERVRPVLAWGMRRFYRWDLARYRRVVDVLFLPTEAMTDYLPRALQSRVLPLPPGLDVVDRPEPHADSPVLFFVGGLGPFYRMHKSLSGVVASQASQMILNVPVENWELMRGEYEQLGGDKVSVHHDRGAGLESLYDQATIGSLFVEPIPYWSFAAPMKMFEYLGHGKPMIASEGTYAASFVKQRGLGWTIPYEVDALTGLLDRLTEHPEEVQKMRENVIADREHHTWEARAAQAAAGLLPRERKV